LLHELDGVPVIMDDVEKCCAVCKHESDVLALNQRIKLPWCIFLQLGLLLKNKLDARQYVELFLVRSHWLKS
jgi:hypothetical protein